MVAGVEVGASTDINFLLSTGEDPEEGFVQ